MFATALIVFREVLEAALIVSIVMAASYGIAGRDRWIGLGIVAGLTGAAIVAMFAAAISEALSGVGQEVFDASVLLVAVVMLGWHVAWMSRHGRELAASVGGVARAVVEGSRPIYALALVTGAAVLREGSETVLFLSGVAAAEEAPRMALVAGGAIGLAGGIISGALLYAGLLRIPVRYLFSFTNGMVLLLAAGMAAQAAGFLVQADLLPSLGAPVWDTTWLLSETSILGKILHAIFGYVSRPAGIQVLSFIATLGVFGALMRAIGQQPGDRRQNKAAASMAAILCVTACCFGGSDPVRADFKVRSPNVDEREIEIEHNFATTIDRRPEQNGRRSMTTEIGIALLPFWQIELEGEIGREPGEAWQFNATTIENTFMLTEPGKYWMDAGLFFEFSRAAHKDDASSIKVGALFQKDVNRFVNTFNIYLEKEVGPNAGTADTLSYAWQTRYRLSPLFQPGIEVYGEIEDLAHAGRLNEQQLRIGPVIAGQVGLVEVIGVGKLKYEAGYLFGATTPTEQGTIRTRLELEIPF